MWAGAWRGRGRHGGGASGAGPAVGGASVGGIRWLEPGCAGLGHSEPGSRVRRRDLEGLLRRPVSEGVCSDGIGPREMRKCV